MYDPARDIFIRGAEEADQHDHDHDHDHDRGHDQQEHAATSPPNQNRPVRHPPAYSVGAPHPPPLKFSTTPIKQSTYTPIPTPGGMPPAQLLSPPIPAEPQMSMSFDFQKPGSSPGPPGSLPTPGVRMGTTSARRMSTIDELLSPASVSGYSGGGGGGGGNGTGSDEKKPSEQERPMEPPLQSQQKPRRERETVMGEEVVQRKLPSFKRKGGINEDDPVRPPAAVPRRDRQRDGVYNQRDRDKVEFDRGRDRERPAPRRRSRSPLRRDPREWDTYRTRSRSPPPQRRRTSRSPHLPPRERFPPRSPPPPHRERFPPRSPPSHLRLLSSNLPREPSPPPPPRSPPRLTRRRPGPASRFTALERETARLLQEANRAATEQVNLPDEDVVRSHYNERPEMGKQWRAESSRIRGLRLLNNWIKSCIIHKFSPSPGLASGGGGGGGGGGIRYGGEPDERLCVLDVGCGKGGDLSKWRLAPQIVGHYIGIDTAEVSIAQARERYQSMVRDQRHPPRSAPYRRMPAPGPQIFRADFAVRDCWVDSLGDVPCVYDVGFDTSVGPGGVRGGGRWATGGGFDVVSMMFCLHYAFESEAKARRMLANVAGSLKKGGRFMGTIPSSDVIKERLGSWAKEEVESREKRASERALATNGVGEENNDDTLLGVDNTSTGEKHKNREFSWGNSIYKVAFSEDVLGRVLPLPISPAPQQTAAPPTTSAIPPSAHHQHPSSATSSTTTGPSQAQPPPSPPYVPGAPPTATPPVWDGRFRPPFGWRYQYHLTEAVEDVPEYIVPWESFRALAEDYNLELIYKKAFHDVWREEGRSGRGQLGALSERMGVREKGWGREGDRSWGGNKVQSLKEREGGLVLTDEEWEASGFYIAFAFRRS